MKNREWAGGFFSGAFLCLSLAFSPNCRADSGFSDDVEYGKPEALSQDSVRSISQDSVQADPVPVKTERIARDSRTPATPYKRESSDGAIIGIVISVVCLAALVFNAMIFSSL